MGLSSRAIVRRLRAWHLGEPLTRGTTIHHETADPADRLLLAFVKMGGETRPWALMWKQGPKRAHFRFVPEPRFRADVDEIAAEFGAVLAAHLRHPAFSGREPAEPADVAPLRQIWVPNRSHIDMLHHFAYVYSFRRPDAPKAAELRLLGRTALFAFLESRRPGQQLVMDASQALRSAYDFPAEDVRQAHLGFLLAWLSERGDRDRGLAAALEAERMPVATALLPDFERNELGPRVEAFNDARRTADKAGMARAEKAIGELLRPELERRLDLVEQAVSVIEDDPRPVNSGVAQLVGETFKAQWWEYVRPETNAIASGRDPYVPSPETDFQARAAARRYFKFDASSDRMLAALVHDDRELEAEAITAGNAFRGTVVHVTDEGSGRRTVPVLVIEDPTPGPLRLRQGDGVCFVGHAKRNGRVRTVETTGGGGIAITVEISNRKTAASDVPWPHSMHAADERWIGHAVTIINTSFADMTDKKAMEVGGRDPLPGDWVLESRVDLFDREEAAADASDSAIDEGVPA